MLSKSVENYLKTILYLYEIEKSSISTNAIAKKINTKPSSVTDMIKKLTNKKLVLYEKYKGVRLTKKGKKIAINIVRKHRLWETFLVNKLKFDWKEVHEIAEQLEHIKSEKLIDKLDKFLDLPQFDPHGEPIPNKSGNFPELKSMPLSTLNKNENGVVMGVIQDNTEFLQYLNKLDIKLGCNIRIEEKMEFDNSMDIFLLNKKIHISHEVAKNILIKKNDCFNKP
tara:strand:- start:38694 stop:39368 length:675 start_codon:yes stop_codon:yes gene_type:complete